MVTSLLEIVCLNLKLTFLKDSARSRFIHLRTVDSDGAGALSSATSKRFCRSTVRKKSLARSTTNSVITNSNLSLSNLGGLSFGAPPLFFNFHFLLASRLTLYSSCLGACILLASSRDLSLVMEIGSIFGRLRHP